MPSLYELTGQMKELEKLAEIDEGTEIAVRNTMEAIHGEFNDKAQALATVMLNMDGNTDMIDREIKRLQDKKKRIQNNRATMIDYLRENMQASGIKKISCPLFSITLVQGRESVIIDDSDEIPDDFVNVKTEITADKVKISKAINDGVAVPGAHVERGRPSVQIK